MGKYVIKVGTCTTSGKLLMEQSEFEEQYASAYSEILDMPKGLERIRETLSLADFCYQNGQDSKASNLYTHVFRSFSWECQGEERILFERALQGLLSLCGSEDECVWEMCSQIIGDYNIWKREQEEKQS